MTIKMKEHWEKVYQQSPVDRLGWYEAFPKSLELIESLGLNRSDAILDIGSGASTLIDQLLERGYSSIIATDISQTALTLLQQRLKGDAQKVRWIVDDVTAPQKLDKIGPVKLWHDRTLLHFLLEQKQQQAYRNLIDKVVDRDGYVIIAVFAVGGAKKCSGLDVKNYSVDMLCEFLGSHYQLVRSFDYLYTMPSGDTRPYIYTLFKKLA